MTRLFFENKNTGNRYEIVGRDAEAGTVLLKGKNSEWEEPYDKEKFAKLGYVLVKEESENA